jgi:NTE family protein
MHAQAADIHPDDSRQASAAGTVRIEGTRREPKPDALDDVFVIFEGGGAKSVAHIGALRALERRGAKIRGAAGTSAGALIAALVAAGYRTDELYIVEGKRTGASPILESVGLRVARDLFRRRDKLALALVIKPLLAFGQWAIALAALAAVAGLIGAGYWAAICPVCGVAAAAIEILLLLLAGRRLVTGLASLEQLHDKLDEGLRKRLGLDRPVTFGDLRQRGRSLRIVATNIDRRTLRLFSDKTTPDMPVADAVAASMAMPFVFRPWKIEGQRHVDGALVSNLPVWTFDEERQLFPDALTIAFEIADPQSVGRTPDSHGVASLLAGIARSAMFGATVLERRATTHLHGFPLQTAVELLDFRLKGGRGVRAVRHAQAYVEAELDFHLFDVPRHYQEACKDIHDGICGVLARSPRLAACPVPPDKRVVRVSVAFQEAGSLDSLRIRHGYGLDGHADNDLLLPIRGSPAGDVYTSQVARLFAIHDASTGPWLRGEQNRHRRRLLWPEMRWLFAIPISSYDPVQAPAESRPAVLLVDSNVPIEYFGLDLTEEEWNWYGRRLGEIVELVDSTLRQRPHQRTPGEQRLALHEHEISLDGIVPAATSSARGKMVLAEADAHAAASERKLAADIQATLARRAAWIARLLEAEVARAASLGP